MLRIICKGYLSTRAYSRLAFMVAPVTVAIENGLDQVTVTLD